MIKFLKYNNEIINKKPVLVFSYAILIFTAVNLFKKILNISFFDGDIFFKLFSFLKTYELSEQISKYFFIKFSFLNVFLSLFILVFFIFIFASQVQFFLHIAVKTPARFSKILNMFYLYAANFYVLVLIPFFGFFLWILILSYLVTKGIAEINFISKIKAFFILLLPVISLIALIIIFITFLFF